MANKKIDRLLVISILVMSIIPVLTSFYLLDEILDNVLSLSFNTTTKNLFRDYQRDLKHLRTIEPEKEQLYKQQFYRINDELLIRDNAELAIESIRWTYITYFLTIFVILLLFSILLSSWLGTKISKSYKSLMSRDMDKAKRLETLRQFDEWQAIASKLAHEIKNPLTPIMMLVSNLKVLHSKLEPEKFVAELATTENVVTEEINKLKDMVYHFNAFAKLPEPKREPKFIVDVLTSYIEGNSNAWPNIRFHVESKTSCLPQVLLDEFLFKQCLVNLINNAQEANPGKAIEVWLSIDVILNNKVKLIVRNSGRTISSAEIDDIFNMYYSTKSEQENMGLGLPIVKKIILDHDGEIGCFPLAEGAAFEIILPKLE